MQTVRHNADKHSCFVEVIRVLFCVVMSFNMLSYVSIVGLVSFVVASFASISFKHECNTVFTISSQICTNISMV